MASDRTALQSLAHMVAGMQDIDTETRATVTLHVIDTIGAWIAAAGTPEGKALLAFRRQMRAQSGMASSVLAEMITHCGIARLSEIDDIHLASMITPGAIVIPAALMICTVVERDVGAFADAIAAGYEVMIRAGTAIDGPTALYRGIWPTFWAAPLGVAAVGARLWGLTEEQTAHALAIALTFAAPGVGRSAGPTTARWFAVGNAARDGVAAVLAAQSGYTSDLNLFEGNFFSGIYNIKPDLKVLTEGFAAPAIASTSFKPWCAARQTMAATTAFKDLRNVVPVEDILAVQAFVPKPHVAMVDHGIVPGDRLSYLTSLPYQIAASALAPESGFDIGKTDPFMSDSMRALMAKVTVTPDDSLLADYPRSWPSRVVIDSLSGRFERTVSHIPGDPERPFDLQQVHGKFRRLLTPIIGKTDCEEVFELALGTADVNEATCGLLRRIEEFYARFLSGPQ